MFKIFFNTRTVTKCTVSKACGLEIVITAFHDRKKEFAVTSIKCVQYKNNINFTIGKNTTVIKLSNIN